MSSGKTAETAVAKELKRQGYKLVAKNWKTKVCEIDIIATKNQTVFFVEVKYRRSDDFGGGFDYITPAKLKQMRFASEIWVSQNNWPGSRQLLAAAVSGKQFENIEILEVI